MIIHSPVLLKEVLSFVPEHSKLIVDGTLWHGGHTLVMAEQFPDAKIIGLDVDESMLQKAELRIENWKLRISDRVTCLQKSYADVDEVMKEQKADYILLDLWVNLEHFMATERGFSLKGNAPLDMRFDQTMTMSALEVVNTYAESDLSYLFIHYGDFTEEKAKELAQVIVRERRKTKIATTFDLKHVLGLCGLGNSAVAVIFQAIRIEVNGELRNIETFLKKFPLLLNSGGRCAIMSYHSLEDRLVKKCFQALADTGDFVLLTKKVVLPHYTEVAKNKAARSAKLRVIEKGIMNDKW